MELTNLTVKHPVLAAKLTVVINSTITTCSTHTHPHNGPLSGTTQVSRYQKGKTNLDFIGARDSEWQWHQLGHVQSTHRSRK